MKVQVDEELMRKLEKLALISLTDQERQEFMRDLAKILDFFNKIDELTLEGVEPMFHPLSTGKLRPDEPAQPLSRDDALANVPKKKDGYIIGPSTIGG
ncbi:MULTISPECIES: Asp-tRNA(Asn) amidotransferase subunit GatC [Metallosphaera]|uniref:Asp-tRNA(Asn) amidotransferase subunit GatC n=1 Tax=Metallosphaera TaxID=41980 RepID=UPI001F0620D7|nr:Asp-tRNA(Asn) amidotransferase subunit GatC [Metallosphaera sedula]MCH1771353.1 Asp-tRNA(Asn) amidotransferase subunit GatC [Metallosphaera sedula]MCP6729743.1 Asp-tRNA(Asn) amidotransferase subunit GatC [Metallosphaera sedula]